MTTALHFIETPQARFGRWTGAALLVVGLHAGGAALALMQWPQDDPSDDVAGAITMELAPIPTAVPRDQADLPPGPEMEEAMLTPQASKRVVEEIDKEIPPLDQSPLAPKPEVVLPMPTPEIKKAEEKEKQEEVPQEQAPTQTNSAPLTTAPPKVEAPPASVAAAPAPGTSNEALRAQASWTKRLIAQLDSHKRYPNEARAQGHRGTVSIQFSLDRAGKLITASVLKSSGSTHLDEEALALMKRASPLPAPPDELTGLALTLPINFNIK